jgi:hypothetical protein
VTNTIVLRSIDDELGSRRLEATVNQAGDLVINGRDYGDGVEQVFGEGSREYEWVWTVVSDDVPRLREALGGDVLEVLAQRFSGDDAAILGEGLEATGVPVDKWSRVGS